MWLACKHYKPTTLQQASEGIEAFLPELNYIYNMIATEPVHYPCTCTALNIPDRVVYCCSFEFVC